MHRATETVPKPKSDGSSSSQTPKSDGSSSSQTPSDSEQLLKPSEIPLVLHESARMKFDRLSDRLEFLILSRTKELVEEKDALISTVSNPSPPSLLLTDNDLVLQYQRTERLGSHCTPDSLCDIVSEAQCAFPSRQSDDQLFLRPNQ
jgi:hypothetical protein